MKVFAGVALSIIQGLLSSGCGSPSTVPVMPTAPTRLVAAVVSGVTVTGKVYDTAYRPIVGATVQVVNGPSAGLSTAANVHGQYWLTGAFDEATQFRATREGYAEGVMPMPTVCEQCNPQHWVYFYLGLPVAPADIAGDYALTVTADGSCRTLPPEMQTRTYPAKIVALANQPTSAKTNFEVRVDGETLLSGVEGGGLSIAVAGDYLELELGDLHGQPGVVDRVYENAYFSFGGLGTTTVGVEPVVTITAAFDGSIEYCVLTPGLSPVFNGRYGCAAPHADTRTVCQAKGHQLILRRQ